MEAIRKAMDDAGITSQQLDGIMSYHGGDSTPATSVMYDLGVRPNFYMDCSGGGSSTEALVGLAMGAIEAGMCDTVAIYRAMNGYSQIRIGGTRGPGRSPGGRRRYHDPPLRDHQRGTTIRFHLHPAHDGVRSYQRASGQYKSSSQQPRPATTPKR